MNVGVAFVFLVTLAVAGAAFGGDETPEEAARFRVEDLDLLAEVDEPVLAAALRAGLNLPHSCKGGHCASCRGYHR